MRGDWTDDDIDLLKKLWAEGKTAAAIATRLGTMSRSAVLGKIFRLRLGPAPAGETATRQNPEKPSSLARRRDGREGKPMAKAKPVPRAKSLFELTNECCRWPYRRPGTEKYFFCGVAEADLEGGIPYCARHMKRAYLVPPRIAAQPPRKSFRAA